MKDLRHFPLFLSISKGGLLANTGPCGSVHLRVKKPKKWRLTPVQGHTLQQGLGWGADSVLFTGCAALAGKQSWGSAPRVVWEGRQGKG